MKSALGTFSKRTMLTISLFLVILMISSVSGAYFVSVNQSNKKDTVAPSNFSSPISTQSPQTTTPPSPTPTASPTLISAKVFLGGPFGGFKVKYNVESRVLSVNGQVLWGANCKLLITYSIDGLGSYTICTNIKPIDVNFPGVDISGSDVLPLLAAGNHSITVYGSLELPGSKATQTTLNFAL